MKEIRNVTSPLAQGETQAVANVMRDITALSHVGDVRAQERRDAAMDVLTSLAAEREDFPSIGKPVRRLRRRTAVASSGEYEMVRSLARRAVEGRDDASEVSGDGRAYLRERHLGLLREELHDVDSGRTRPPLLPQTRIAMMATAAEVIATGVSQHVSEFVMRGALAALFAAGGFLAEARNRRQYQLDENGRLLRKIDAVQQEK